MIEELSMNLCNASNENNSSWVNESTQALNRPNTSLRESGSYQQKTQASNQGFPPTNPANTQKSFAKKHDPNQAKPTVRATQQQWEEEKGDIETEESVPQRKYIGKLNKSLEEFFLREVVEEPSYIDELSMMKHYNMNK